MEDKHSIHITFETYFKEPGKTGYLEREVRTTDRLCFIIDGGDSDAEESKANAQVEALIKAVLTDVKKNTAKMAKLSREYYSRDTWIAVNVSCLTKTGGSYQSARFWAQPNDPYSGDHFRAFLSTSQYSGGYTRTAIEVAFRDIDGWLHVVRTYLKLQFIKCFISGTVDSLITPDDQCFELLRSNAKHNLNKEAV